MQESGQTILVTGSYNKSLIFWDATSGQKICEPIEYFDYGITGLVNRMEISLDKKFLGCACTDQVIIFDIHSEQSPEQMKSVQTYENEGNVTGIGFQKDNKWIYTCSEDGKVKIHDIRANSGIAICFETKNEPYNCVVMHPNEAELIAGDQLGNLKFFDLRKQQIKATLKSYTNSEKPDTHIRGIRSICIADNGDYMIAGDSSGYCDVYQSKGTQDFQQSNFFLAHNDYILKCQISSDSKQIATCSADKSIKIWSLNKNEEKPKFIKTLFGHTKWVWDCAFSSDCQYLISVSTDRIAKIWDIESGQIERSLQGHQSGINCVAMNDFIYQPDQDDEKDINDKEASQNSD